MTLGERLKTLRQDLGLSQEALGAQGFVSTPGWIKIENGQRQASETLIDKLTRWLVEDKYMRSGAANALKEELLTLKYLGSRSPFVREMARTHAKKLPTSAVLLAAEEPIRSSRLSKPPERRSCRPHLGRRLRRVTSISSSSVNTTTTSSHRCLGNFQFLPNGALFWSRTGVP